MKIRKIEKKLRKAVTLLLVVSLSIPQNISAVAEILPYYSQEVEEPATDKSSEEVTLTERVCQVKCVSSFLHLFPQLSAV